MKIAVNSSTLTNGDDLNFAQFEKLGEVKFFGDIPRDELFKLCADVEALVVNNVKVDEALINACPNLKYVGTFATGYNVVDIEACRRRKITVCNAPNYSTHSVSQHAVALLLELYSRTGDYVQSVKRGDWINSKTFCYFPYSTHELYGKTFGIYGYGNIGSAVAKIADAFGAKVIVCTRNAPKDIPYELVDFDEILERSDVLSLHCPLNEETAKMINAQTLKKMKKTAVIINTARGGLIDETALANALNNGELAGAGLDTLAVEPMVADSPLYKANNCLITPHIGWTPHETRERLLSIVAGNLKAYIDGKPINVVS